MLLKVQRIDQMCVFKAAISQWAHIGYNLWIIDQAYLHNNVVKLCKHLTEICANEVKTISKTIC